MKEHSMPEPTSTTGISIAALSIAVLGPLAGPYALILFASLAGSLWPLSASSTVTRVEGAWLVLRCTLTSVVLTGGAASWLQAQYGVQINESIAPVAFIFGALGNGWRAVLDSVTGVVATVVARIGTGGQK
jgi:hypothetical protein